MGIVIYTYPKVKKKKKKKKKTTSTTQLHLEWGMSIFS